jgi:hypothetical protein
MLIAINIGVYNPSLRLDGIQRGIGFEYQMTYPLSNPQQYRFTRYSFFII